MEITRSIDGHMNKILFYIRKGKERTANQNKIKYCTCGNHSTAKKNAERRRWDKKNGEWWG